MKFLGIKHRTAGLTLDDTIALADFYVEDIWNAHGILPKRTAPNAIEVATAMVEARRRNHHALATALVAPRLQSELHRSIRQAAQGTRAAIGILEAARHTAKDTK